MTLDEIASEIVKEQSQFKNELRAAVVRAKNLGELLLKAKEQIPHGEFGEWVTKKAKLSQTWAATYMAIARGWDAVEKYGVDISVRQAEDVARGRPVKKHGGEHDASVSRLLHKLEERVANIVLDHPEIADIVDAIHSWRERLEKIGRATEKRGVAPKHPQVLAEKVRNAHKHGYKAKQIHAELKASGVSVSYEWVRQICAKEHAA